jgi:SOS response regulatory protein OraA/RecX
VDDIYHHALKLLRRRDYTQKQLFEKLESKFGRIPDDVASGLIARRFLDDRRYADNFVAKHPYTHPNFIRQSLQDAGVDDQTIGLAIDAFDWPSLRTVLKAKMTVWRLSPPLNRRDAARLFSALSRLGYPEDEIREELEQLHEQ